MLLKSIYGRILLLFVAIFFFMGFTASSQAKNDSAPPALITFSLEECIQTALANNHRRPASWFALQMAEAQHHQALAAYWPQITGQAGYQRLDEPLNFLYPSRKMPVSAQSISLPSGFSIPMTAPDGSTVPLTAIDVPEQEVDVEEQEVKLLDENIFTASVRGQWLIYDGGLRRGHREQTKAQVAMMKTEVRRTDLEIINDVKKMYYGAVLSEKLYELGRDTQQRLETTLLLTETLYKQGSGRVKKTDWLDNKVTAESIRSMVALLEKNKLMAQAALANTIGMSWKSSVCPKDKEIPHAIFEENLDELVATVYQFNPDWKKIEQGLLAAQGMERTAQSGYFPKVALSGELNRFWNEYDKGLSTPENRTRWSVGIGLEIPLFEGFLTKNKIKEARARIAKIQEEKILLKEGLGLQIKNLFIGLQAAEKSYIASRKAMQAAKENRDLNTRAYQMELVETEKVIRAQLMEALMSAQHYKTCYDQIVLQANLQLMLGREVVKVLEGR